MKKVKNKSRIKSQFQHPVEKKKLKEESLADADESLKIAKEWFTIEQEAWDKIE